MPESGDTNEQRKEKMYKPALLDTGTIARIGENLAQSSPQPGKNELDAALRGLTLAKLALSSGFEDGELADDIGWFLAQVRLKVATILPEGAKLGRLKLWIAGGRVVEGGKTLTQDTDFDLTLSYEGDDAWKQGLDDVLGKRLDSQVKDVKDKLNAKLNETLLKNKRHIVDVLNVRNMLTDARAQEKSQNASRPFHLFATEAL